MHTLSIASISSPKLCCGCYTYCGPLINVDQYVCGHYHLPKSIILLHPLISAMYGILATVTHIIFIITRLKASCFAHWYKLCTLVDSTHKIDRVVTIILMALRLASSRPSPGAMWPYCVHLAILLHCCCALVVLLSCYHSWWCVAPCGRKCVCMCVWEFPFEKRIYNQFYCMRACRWK